MLVKVSVLNLQVNLPLEDCEVFFLLNDKNRLNSLPEQLIYERTDQYVLMPEPTDLPILDKNFMVQVQNSEEQKSMDLNVYAISSSNSKVVLLGSTEINIRNLLNYDFQTLQKKTVRQLLRGIQNQKGSILIELLVVQSQFCEFEAKTKLFESLQKEQTSSSDSYQANLKQLNKHLDGQNFKLSYSSDEPAFEKIENIVSSQQIIFQEIDLEDYEQEEELDSYKKNLTECETEIQYTNFNNISTESFNQIEEKYLIRSEYFLQEQLKIAKYLHKLQECDFLMMKAQERLRNFLE